YLCESPIDGAIAAVVATDIAAQVDPVVESRPKHTVGKTSIVLVVFPLGKRDCNEIDIFLTVGQWRLYGICFDFSVPAQPDPAHSSQGIQDTHNQASGGAFTLGDRRDPI